MTQLNKHFLERVIKELKKTYWFDSYNGMNHGGWINFKIIKKNDRDYIIIAKGNRQQIISVESLSFYSDNIVQSYILPENETKNMIQFNKNYDNIYDAINSISIHNFMDLSKLIYNSCEIYKDISKFTSSGFVKAVKSLSNHLK